MNGLPIVSRIQIACIQEFHQLSIWEWRDLQMSREKGSQQPHDCLLQLQLVWVSGRPVMQRKVIKLSI